MCIYDSMDGPRCCAAWIVDCVRVGIMTPSQQGTVKCARFESVGAFTKGFFAFSGSHTKTVLFRYNKEGIVCQKRSI